MCGVVVTSGRSGYSAGLKKKTKEKQKNNRKKHSALYML